MNSYDRKFKIYKCVLCCLVYGIFDYAVCLLNLGLKNGFLTKDEYSKILNLIKDYSKKIRFPDFPRKVRVFNFLLRCCRIFQPPSNLGFADGDRDIGNIRDR